VIGERDKQILRELCRRKAEIGNLPIQRKKTELWRDLNGLRPTRPVAWITQVPWNEVEAAAPDELAIRCEGGAMEREAEAFLRRELYQWSHFPCDMVVEPVFYVGKVCGPGGALSDFGLEAKASAVEGCQDVAYTPVIDSEADADKIRTPSVWYDEAATRRNTEALTEALDGVIPVKVMGISQASYAPWDLLIQAYGIERLYTDMFDKPWLVHRVISGLSQALTGMLDRQVEMGLLDVSTNNWSVGSGGVGITDALPSANPDGHKVQPREQWGGSRAQIFTEVSPDMHEEFSLQYERPLLERFGLSYYGCCEPLHKKVDLLRTIRNLRKISMSPWINLDEASEKMGADYVFSFKPHPAHLAFDRFDPDRVRSYLRDVMIRTGRNRCEFILKDITTVRGDPSRLEQWAQIAMEVVCE